jgi:hypothetical protein
MASLNDILTVGQSIVKAVTSAAQTYQNVQGAQSAAAISAATVVKTTGGRICIVSVTTAGSTTGAIYDANATGVTTKPVYVIPDTVGRYEVNLPTSYGILVVPGTSQVVTVSWS